ncbi:hypothetical protein B0H13DRAFT_2453378 [Mycena leptocephala]|nr:hypothetical protein B0H13DRAFT_2453378 [Mycena leptocephala]
MQEHPSHRRPACAHYDPDAQRHRHAQRSTPSAYQEAIAMHTRRPSTARLPARPPCGTSHRLSSASSVPASLKRGVRHPPRRPAVLAVAGPRLQHHHTTRGVPRDYNATITPAWGKWDVEQTEMLFNQTVDDVPLVEPVTTSDALLKRCQFWNSVGGLTAQ